ncbi:MAG: DUF4368 domain-containing protein [Lachnoclostridium sp.]
MVHAPRYLDGKRVQLIDIYYNGVGILREAHSRRNGRSVPKSYGGTQSKNGIANGYTA